MQDRRPRFQLFQHSPNARAFPAGHQVFGEGEPGQTMFAVKSGRVAIVVGGATADELGPGDVFGEMALLESLPRTASAVTLEPSELVEIDRPQFYILVRQNPHFALQLMQLLSERLRRADALYRQAASE